MEPGRGVEPPTVAPARDVAPDEPREETPMCMNCGCGEPDDDRGKPENITAQALRAAADANGQSLRESAQHIVESVEQLEGSREHRGGLAEPAGRGGAAAGGRGTPASES
jgi:hypothetical protein